MLAELDFHMWLPPSPKRNYLHVSSRLAHQRQLRTSLSTLLLVFSYKNSTPSVRFYMVNSSAGSSLQGPSSGGDRAAWDGPMIMGDRRAVGLPSYLDLQPCPSPRRLLSSPTKRPRIRAYRRRDHQPNFASSSMEVPGRWTSRARRRSCGHSTRPH